MLQGLGMDIASIARQLDVPEGTVSRLFRARAALAPMLRADVTGRV